MSMTKMELELSTPLLLEELRKRMPTARTATLEPSKRTPTLLGHRVHGVLAVVEPSAELRCGEDLVGFVEERHLCF